MGRELAKYKNQISKVNSLMTKYQTLTTLTARSPKGGRGFMRSAVISVKNASFASYIGIVIGWNPKAIEDSGRIYFGVDMNSNKFCELYTSGYHEDFKYKFTEKVLDTSSYRYNLDFKAIRDSTLSEISDAYSLSGMLTDDIVKAIKRDLSMLDMSPTYKSYKGIFDKIISDIKTDIHLKDKEFPNLSDRGFFPYVIFDIESGSVNYCISSQASSYRQGRNSVTWEYFINNTDRVVRDALDNTRAMYYVDIDFNHPDVRGF